MLKTSDVQQYELTFILDEKAAAEDGKKKTAALTDIIKTLGGSVEKDEQWGRRELAYVIKRNRSGFYVTMWFGLPTAGLPSLIQTLNFDAEIIRSLVTKAYTTAQPGTLYPVAEPEKTDRKERGGRPGAGGKEQPEEAASAEEMLRRSAAAPAKEAKAKEEDVASALPEEERLKQLDETLEELLKEEE